MCTDDMLPGGRNTNAPLAVLQRFSSSSHHFRPWYVVVYLILCPEREKFLSLPASLVCSWHNCFPLAADHMLVCFSCLFFLKKEWTNDDEVLVKGSGMKSSPHLFCLAGCSPLPQERSEINSKLLCLCHDRQRGEQLEPPSGLRIFHTDPRGTMKEWNECSGKQGWRGLLTEVFPKDKTGYLKPFFHSFL